MAATAAPVHSGGVSRGSTKVGAGLVIGALGVVVTIKLSGSLTSVRQSVGPTNVALILVVVVMTFAAVGGRIAGLATALAAALSFDYFHTVPYNTLRINSARDIETVVLLLLVGAVVGELAQRRERHRSERVASDDLLAGVLVVGHLVSEGFPLDVVWNTVKTALVRGFDLRGCRYEPFGTEAPALPRIDFQTPVPRLGLRRFSGQGFELAEQGAELPVAFAGDMLGRIVLEPREPRGVSVKERRVAVALAEQLAIVLARHGHTGALA